MRVLIEIQLMIEGSKSSSRGSFYVNYYDFQRDSNFAVGVIAYKWIEERKAMTGQRKTEIFKVTWNEEHDITEVVKNIRPNIPIDNLPF